jgi:hypothetical protein
MGFEVSHVPMLKGSKNGKLLKDIMTQVEDFINCDFWLFNKLSLLSKLFTLPPF